ncbi:alpha-amylase family glycosyl hydrolase [Ekhidna sp.]
MRKLLISALLFTCLTTFSQDISITFEVDMSYQIELDKFNPDAEYVDVAGTFNNWGTSLTKLSDSDKDGIWEATVNGFNADQKIEFKFRYNGAWNDREEFPGSGNNRTHVVSSGDETLSFWYNDEESPTGPALADVNSSSTFVFTGGSVLFSDNSSGLIENTEWVFEGGNPSVSTDRNVSVTYETPGSYNVTLRVSNSFSSDEIVLSDYITVGDQSEEDLNWWNETTFYEIFVRSFYDSDGDGIGDFNGITEKLDYLNDGDPNTTNDLGITGIWLMPIHDSPSYHGYDVNDYRSINPDYGTMDDFENFLSEAHKRGIKVIIDLVLNHTSTEIEWFKNARSSSTSDKRNWYRWTESKPSYSGPWGQTVWHGGGSSYYYGLFWGGMPDLNYDEEEVRNEIFDITRFWLEDIGIDGYRLDAVKYIHEKASELEDISETHAFWRDWVAVTKESNPNALSVGEAWTSTEKIVPYVVNRGLDFCFDFDLSSAMISSINGKSAIPLKNQINKVINSYPYFQFGTFASNHDQNRIMDELGSNESKVKLIAASYFMLPGVPFVYYGEEVAMKGTKPDEDIRRPMPWSNDSNGGFSDSSPWNSLSSNYKTNNVEVGMEDPNSVFNWYRKLIQLRGKEVALQKGTYREINTGSDEVLGFWREYEGEQVLVLINYGESTRSVEVNTSNVFTTTESSALVDQLDASYRIDLVNKSELTITLDAEQSRVLKTGPLTLGLKSEEAIQLFPNPASTIVRLNSKLGNQVDYEILTIDGKLVKSGTYEYVDGIDISKLSRGIYLVKLKSDQKELTSKLYLR